MRNLLGSYYLVVYLFLRFFYRRILIDTGEPNFPEYIRNLQETMNDYNFQLDHIIITHWHKDHFGGVNDVLDMINNKNGNFCFSIFCNVYLIFTFSVFAYLFKN